MVVASLEVERRKRQLEQRERAPVAPYELILEHIANEGCLRVTRPSKGVQNAGSAGG